MTKLGWSRAKSLVPILFAALLLSIHAGSILYVNSSLLSKYFGARTVSIIFLVGAALNVTLFLFASRLIEKYGKKFFLIFFLTLSFLSSLGLAVFNTGWLITLSFVIYSGVLLMVYYSLDIFLEEHTIDAYTGGVRGLYFTFINIGIALGPVMLSLLAKGDDFKSLYLMATFILLPILILAFIFFKPAFPISFRPYHSHHLLPFKAWWDHKSIRRITLSRFVLEFFFVFMVIYTPMYLHEYMGFDWSNLGVVFTIALLPFIFLEWPAGKVADWILGEKEILIVGFLIMIASLLIMPSIGPNIFTWAIILLISRIGASLVEIMTESYFFKKIDSNDTGLISIFRMARPVSSILGTIVGVLALSFVSFDKIFFILAIVVFLGLRESLLIRDSL